MTIQPLSTVKIFILVILACGILFTALFIYHSRHSSSQVMLANNVGMIFPVPREIKPFQLMTTDQQVFNEKSLRDHWTLLFFGFTHCSNICPTTLDLLKKVYEKLYLQHPTLQVVFVSLDPDRDTTLVLNRYIKSFQPRLIGVTGPIQDLRKLQSQFGVFSALDPQAPQQIQHTASIMLVNPRGEWLGLYHYGISQKELMASVKEVITG